MATFTLGDKYTMVNTVQNAMKAYAISIISTTAVKGMTAPITNVPKNK